MYEDNGQPCVGPFDTVPDEVLLMIFSNLSHYDLWKNCSVVCQRWHDVAMSKCLWRKLSFDRTWPTETVKKVLSMAKAPTSITLDERCDIEEYNSILLERSNGLEHLTITRCAQRRNFPCITEILSKCKILKSLNVDDSTLFRNLETYETILENLTRWNVKVLGTALPELVNLSSLRVNFAFCFESQLFSQFISNLSLSSVEHLEIHVQGISDESLSLLSQCQQLRSLQLYYAYNLGPKGIEAIGTPQNMSSLFIDGYGNFSKAKTYALDLAEAFKTGKLQNLTTFALTNCDVYSNWVSDVALFCAIGECCHSLRNVSLRRSAGITAEGLLALKNACPELRLLDIYMCDLRVKLNVQSVQAVIENLRELIISELYFGKEVCNTIIEWEKKNSRFFIAKIGADKAGQIDEVFVKH